MRRPLAASYRLGGCDQRGRHGFDTNIAGVVRRKDDFGVTPERMRRRQRLGRKDVECRAFELTALQGRQQIRLDEMLAASDLDQIAARRILPNSSLLRMPWVSRVSGSRFTSTSVSPSMAASPEDP